MKLRFSPSTVIAVVAVFVALGSSAVAAGVFSGTQKREITKIAGKVFESRIQGASVKQAATAAKATEAAKAAEATKASEAAKATEATRATTATRATEATRATSAADAEKLGGKPAGTFQARVSGTCPAFSPVTSVAADGTVQCATTGIKPFRLELTTGQDRTTADLGNGFGVRGDCTFEPPSFVLLNLGPAVANLNFSAVDDGVVRSEGKRLPVNGGQGFRVDARVEGTAVFSTPTGITSVTFHAFNGNEPDLCEITGTAVSAAG